jgi:hypothetical protein
LRLNTLANFSKSREAITRAWGLKNPPANVVLCEVIVKRTGWPVPSTRQDRRHLIRRYAAEVLPRLAGGNVVREAKLKHGG